MKNETVFFTLEQAAEAICRDFRQYPPQLLLFCEVLRLVADRVIRLRPDIRKKGVWISVCGRNKMRWLEGQDLVVHLCDAVGRARLDPVKLAEVCARVFQTRAYPAAGPETGQTGVAIETGMHRFACRQCGQCCRSLDYHNEVEAADIARWRSMGRSDILRWVGVYRHTDAQPTYRIWVDPATGQPAASCPFLKSNASENRWVCGIHDVKPEICRQYPTSRKHARMTGCPGFGAC
jgi:Fe-S-cluster containining protein